MLASANNDEDLVVAELAHEKDKNIKKLHKLFSDMDKDGSGDIEIGELKSMLKDPVAAAVFQSLEMNISQAEGVFELIDDGDSKLSFDEFLTGILRLKGSAKAIDLVTVL